MHLLYKISKFQTMKRTRRNITAIPWVLFAGFLATGAHGDQEPGMPLLPVAKFTEVESTAAEQNGRIKLKVSFSGKFVGSLSYSVHGTADQMMDFELPEDTVTSGIPGS